MAKKKKYLTPSQKGEELFQRNMALVHTKDDIFNAGYLTDCQCKTFFKDSIDVHNCRYGMNTAILNTLEKRQIRKEKKQKANIEQFQKKTEESQKYIEGK